MIDRIDLAERAVLPEWLIRFGVRRLMTERLRQGASCEAAQPGESRRRFLDELRYISLSIVRGAVNRKRVSTEKRGETCLTGEMRDTL
ncbi:MAG: hypothetical protein NUV77_19685 [Thermoguttaceae bacterium]|nr:hypothetical protein [Thermoguttaceae bacterium]